MENEGYSYCRLCAEFKRMTTLLDIENKIDEIISKLNRINANADLRSARLPKTVCIQCMFALNGAFEFVLGVERAQSILSDVNREIKQEVPDDVETESSARQITTETLIEIKLEKEKTEILPVEQDQNVIQNDEQTNLLEKALKSCDRSATVPVERNVDTSKVKKAGGTVRRVNEETMFGKKNKLDLNNVSMWKDYIWKCSICDTQFTSHEELKNHSIEFHKICNTQQCFDCNRRSGSLDKFILHVRRHREHYKYFCYICFRQVSTPRESYLHKLTHLATSNVCKGCNSTFKTVQELMDHTATYFRDIYSKNPKIVDLTCEVCSKTFGTAQALTRHLRVHTDRIRDHICDTCGKRFHNKYDLKGHMNMHSDERPFPCDICKQRFKLQKHLRKHLKIHLAKRQYTCDQCGRSFKFRAYLESHLIVHTDLLPHVCIHCNKAFRSKNALNKHLRQHTGVKPYSCNVCHRQFTGWPNYNKHMKTQHNKDMSKRKHFSRYSDDVANSEDMKKYVESVFNETKGRGRPKIIKPLKEVTVDQPIEN